jgi:hypothetical protein
MAVLEELAVEQCAWSQTANALHRKIDRTRWLTFFMSSMAALFAAVASQLHAEDGEQLHLILAVSSAVLLGGISYLSARLLTSVQVQDWVRARVASEALKRMAFKFAAQVAPYDDQATREPLLADEKSKVLADVDDLLGQLVRCDRAGSSPITMLTPDQYIEVRIKRQVDWYEARAASFKRAVRRLRITEFILSLVATLVAAAAGVAGNSFFTRVDFDVVALTAVLTTVAAYVISQIEASRYDFLIVNYRSTANRLKGELARLSLPTAQPSNEWNAFVNACETLISNENASWMAKWTKPDS